MPDERELALMRMMEAADANPDQRAKLLDNPEAFAREWNVKLEPAEVEQFKLLSTLTSLIDRLNGSHGHIPGPIFYPIDVWVKDAFLSHVVFDRSLFRPFPGVYPLPGYPYQVGRIARLLERRYNLQRRG
jgi:hypothetical protein